MCSELVLIFPFPQLFMGLKVGNARAPAADCGTAQLRCVSPPPSRSLSFSRRFTSPQREHRGPGALPCSPSNDGMRTPGQLNPGLTLTTELSAHEGGREGGGGETPAVKEREEPLADNERRCSVPSAGKAGEKEKGRNRGNLKGPGGGNRPSGGRRSGGERFRPFAKII